MSKQLICAGLAVTLLGGCLEALEEQTKKSDTFIVGKTTQEVAKLDPEGDDVVDFEKKKQDSMIMTASLETYTEQVVKINQLYVHHAVRLFQATNDRFPKDYDEFMSQIIKANNIRLPVLPGDLAYAYDEENHQLLVIRSEDAGAPAESQ